MNRPERQQERKAVSTHQVLLGAHEDLGSEAKRLIENHKTGKLVLEVYFDSGHATKADLHVKYGCKK